MTDYLGDLTLGTTGTYVLRGFEAKENDSGGVDVTLKVSVSAASADALATAVEALATELRRPNVYARSWPGVTNPVLYELVECTELTLEKIDAGSSWSGLYQVITCTLTMRAQPDGALATIYNAQSVSAPGALTLASLLGTRRPTLDLVIDDASGNDMHSVHACLALRVLTDNQAIALSRGHWLVYASSLSWTTLSAGGATGTAWSNNPQYTTSAAWQAANLDTSGYPAGTYKLWGRPKQAAGIGYLMDSQNQAAYPVTRTSFHLLDMGTVQLPVRDTVYGTAANLTLYARSDGTNRLDVDAYLLLPVDIGLVFYHPDIDTEEADEFAVGRGGIFIDSVTDLTSIQGDALRPGVLAAHVATLVDTEEPSGSTWPSDWNRTDSTDVTADTSRFKVGTTTGSKYAWYAAAAADSPLVVPGEWYELTLTRSVTAHTAGNAVVILDWLDIDGTLLRSDTLSSVATTDASPVSLELYDYAPAQANRARVRVGADGSANLTAYFYDVALRRCPLQLITVAEDAAGALSSNRHAVYVTVQQAPVYEVSR